MRYRTCCCVSICSPIYDRIATKTSIQKILVRCNRWQIPNSNTADDATRYAAIELFQQAARRARPDFALTPENTPHVIRICRLVQGMPFGILLVAPWVTVLSTVEIAEEIQRSLDILEAEESDLPKRLRSIRAMFDQGWSMMTEAEQLVFMNMTLFIAQAAVIYVHDGRPESAAELLGLALKQPVKAIGWMEQWVLLNHVQAELQAELGLAAFEAARERGKLLDLKATSEEVLREIEAFSK